MDVCSCRKASEAETGDKKREGVRESMEEAWGHL